MIILAITTDDKLINQLKSAGEVMKYVSVDAAKTIINNSEINTVVVGDPYTDINPKMLGHNNVIIIKNKNDLNQFLKTKKKPNVFDEFNAVINKTPEEVKPARKMRAQEQDPQKAVLKDLGTVLLVTTNIELVKYLSEFNIRVSTTCYSVLKAMTCNPKIIIWDLNTEPLEMGQILVYRWGQDLKHIEDVTQVLINMDISLA